MQGADGLRNQLRFDGVRRTLSAVIAPARHLVIDDAQAVSHLSDRHRRWEQKLILIEAVVRDRDKRGMVAAVMPAEHRTVGERRIAEAQDALHRADEGRPIARRITVPIPVVAQAIEEIRRWQLLGIPDHDDLLRARPRPTHPRGVPDSLHR